MKENNGGDWSMVRLTNLQASKKWALNGGPFGSKLVSRDYVPAGVPVIRGGNISGDSKFSLEDVVFVSEEKATELAANNAHPGDLVFTQRGTLGQVGLIPLDCGYERFVISQSQMKLTVDQEKADPEYLYYYFRAPQTVQRINNLGISSGVPHINLDILRNFEVNLPPRRMQQRIAEVLSAYDNLIETNTRRITILEEMAQALYREWFVNFRFPGHQEVEMGESDMGPVPERWKASTVGEVADVNARSIKSGDAPGQINYINISGVSQGRIDEVERIDWEDAPSRARRIVQDGDVIWSTVRPNLRAFSLVLRPEPDTVASTGFAVLSATDVPYSYLYLHTATPEFADYLVNHTRGSAYPAVNVADFKGAPILLPQEKVLEDFHRATEPLLQEQKVLTENNRILQETRDLLLPKLVFGEIAVSSVDEAPENAVA